jgi:protein-disulfide isomerase
VVDPGEEPLGAPTRGATFAKVVIHHFGDIETPATQKTELILDRIVEKYRDQVQVVWRHRPLDAHDSARDLANAAEEVKAQAGNDAFFAFVKAASAKSSTPGSFDSAGILQLATDASKTNRYGYVSSYGLKNAVDGKKHDARIRADENKADLLDLTYVPTVIVGKYQINGAVTYGRVKATVEKALKDAP